MRIAILIVIALLVLCLESEVVHGATATLPGGDTNLRVSVWGGNLSIGNSGVGVEIRTYSYPIPSSDKAHYFWVGDNLANGGFIQFGYVLEAGVVCLSGSRVGGQTSCNGSDNVANGDVRWFWEYWPNGNAVDFYFGLGAVNSAGPDGT